MQDKIMATEKDAAKTANVTSLRIWPVLLLLPLMLVSRNASVLITDGPSFMWMFSAFGPALGAMAILFWWTVMSRAGWLERFVGLVLMICGLVATVAIMHPSMRDVGVIVMTFPLGVSAFAIMLAVFSRSPKFRRTGLAVTAGISVFLTTALLKADGVWGNFAMETDWRWAPSGEQKLQQYMAANSAADAGSVPPPEAMAISLAEVHWPGFRGPNADGVVHGVEIDRDWEANPPKELWRIPVGSAWSSFVAVGDLLFTQEQRGEEEALVCYNAVDGRQMWTQSVPARFFEALGGLGPRATPTLDGTTIYVAGAEGLVTAVSAIDARSKWQVDLKELAGRGIPMWGFSSSPLVYQNKVVIYAGGSGDKGLFALDSETGEVLWNAPCGSDSYATAKRMMIAGSERLAILSDEGLHLYDPEDGALQLTYEWKHQGYRALQPHLIGEDQVLIPTGMGSGTRLIQIRENDGKLVGEEIWTSRRLKSDFNDCVVLGDHIYGFDDSIFTCIRISDGEAEWKKGRYGKGQVLLVADSNALIVQGERGEIVLLDATPEGHRELGRVEGVEGKSWNHPIVVGNRLYARSADQAVCYELKLSEGTNDSQPDTITDGDNREAASPSQD